MIEAITITAMTDTIDNAALLRLMTWLSPAFPVGAFSYSHGLERAIDDRHINDRASLQDWLTDLLRSGSAWNDAVLFVESWRRADSGDIAELADLGEAMAGSKERHMETMLQGNAFLKAAKAWPGTSDRTIADAPYPVSVAITAAANGVGLHAALTAYLHGFVSNLIQGAVRLVPLGQTDGIAVLAGLEPLLLDIAARATTSTLDDLGSAAIRSDIAAMQHETQYSRVFRS